jgi:hypothetical protein
MTQNFLVQRTPVRFCHPRPDRSNLLGFLVKTVKPGSIRLFRHLAYQSWEVCHDPFFNETNLRKQERLFASKAAALHGTELRYQQSMRHLYITIAEHCRQSLQQLQPRP